MKFPCLVLSQFCTTPVALEFAREGLNEYGEPLAAIKFEGVCNYQDKAKTIYTAQKKLVEIKGTLLLQGDACPQLAVISGGSATICGEKRRILEGYKRRNPDGTVNFTEVVLI